VSAASLVGVGAGVSAASLVGAGAGVPAARPAGLRVVLTAALPPSQRRLPSVVANATRSARHLVSPGTVPG
jgi:hypothetical protein